MDFQFDFGALDSDFSESESEHESEPETQNDSQESDSEEEFEDSDFELEDGQPFRKLDARVLLTNNSCVVFRSLRNRSRCDFFLSVKSCTIIVRVHQFW